MKRIALLIIALVALTISNTAFAQDTQGCAATVSLFTAPAKAKNYQQAYTYYDKVVKECPQSSYAVYQYAERMFKDFIGKGDVSKFTELEQMYKMSAQYYPTRVKEGDVLSDLAQVKYNNKIGTMQDQFNAFDTAFKRDAENFTSPKGLYTYFSLAKDLYSDGKKDLQDVFDLYDVVKNKMEQEEGKLAQKLTALIEREENGDTLSSKDKKRLKAYEKNLGIFGKVKGSVDSKLGNVADCPNLVPLYNKDFEEKKDDIKWIRNAAGRLSGKDCTDDPLFIKLVEQLDRLEPSANTKMYLGQLESQKGNSEKALAYFEESAGMQTDPNSQARIYYKIAEEKRKSGSYGPARSYYNKMLKVKPNAGIAYLKIAQMIAKSSNSCGGTVFEKRAVNWKAAEYADRAARVDPSIADNARSAATSYRARAPQKADIFSAGMAGKTVSLKCWVGGSIRVPNL
ncbi:tetratricopeptide repeat protein [Patiriisocius sp. Uisw_017]|jgi:tetratricopeptide (TPR) repeat protein|uniref:tetratricopeptide repeat protein n=1 Tax=Patiriisocius sp. Uisw_017 TaxID=3230968 RepID=UPI0039EBE3EE